MFIVAFMALTAVTLLSLGLGCGLRELLPPAMVPWLAASLFPGFGLRLLMDAQDMGGDLGGLGAGVPRRAADRHRFWSGLVPWLAVGAGKWISGRTSETLRYRLSGGLFSLKQSLG